MVRYVRVRFHGKYERGDHEPCQQARGGIARGTITLLYTENIKERVLEENIDFGLISPYKAQVQYIRKLIKQDAFFKPLRRLITVHTVDGFQGQERDVILISLVRANEDGKIGFLNDLRRMNVAITRARMKLMILGDASTLTRHAFYNELYNYISQRGKIITINTKQEHEL